LSSIDIRIINTLEDIELAQKLEGEIWSGTDTVPGHQYYTAVQNGGLLLGAYINKQLVGFSYSFPGYKNKVLYLYSHMLGIKEGYRSLGIGEQLKWRQREEAIKLGYSLICWTYDPLEAVNASLNIRKLRGIIGNYYHNYYGEMNDELNKGISSDRFLVHWWIQSKHVEQKNIDKNILVQDHNCLLDVKLNSKMQPHIFNEKKIMIDVNEYFVPIPSQFQQLKNDNLPLAKEWRHKTRNTFTNLLEAGYTAVNLIKDENKPICYYHFVKKDFVFL